MKIENIKYDSFNEFFKDILPTGKMSDTLSGFIFRGESTNTYELLPSALREKNKSKLWEGKIHPVSELVYWQIFREYMYLRDFYIIANNSGLKIPYIKSIRENCTSVFPNELLYMQQDKYKWIPRDYEELAALAQHYGGLTRLLDWTYEIYIALYFAAMGAIKREFRKEGIVNDNIVIWALDADHIQFLQTTKDKSPLRFVVPSYYSNPNLNAQKGVLTYWEIEMEADTGERKVEKVDRTPLDKLIFNYDANKDVTILYKFEFPVSDCIEVFNYLKKMGYEASRLFPGYGGVSRCIEERGIVNQIEKNRNK